MGESWVRVRGVVSVDFEISKILGVATEGLLRCIIITLHFFDVRPGGVKTECGFNGYGVSRNEIPQNQTMNHLWVIGLDKIQITRLL